MKLYSNPASPFARKCRVVALELGLTLELIDVNARDDETLRRLNPLKKIPVLLLDDGSVLFDSRVICEYLNDLGGGRFYPSSLVHGNRGLWKALMLQALGDGIMDAAVACRYESIQPKEKQNADFMARYMTTVRASLDTLERVPLAKKATIGEIAVGCALGYLDFRYADLGWREGHPKLSAWYEAFAKYPAMLETAPPE